MTRRPNSSVSTRPSLIAQVAYEGRIEQPSLNDGFNVEKKERETQELERVANRYRSRYLKNQLDIRMIMDWSNTAFDVGKEFMTEASGMRPDLGMATRGVGYAIIIIAEALAALGVTLKATNEMYTGQKAAAAKKLAEQAAREAARARQARDEERQRQHEYRQRMDRQNRERGAVRAYREGRYDPVRVDRSGYC